MKAKRRKFRSGLTFIEILLASAILLIAVVGTAAFRYNAALGARKADIRSTAARTALLQHLRDDRECWLAFLPKPSVKLPGFPTTRR